MTEKPVTELTREEAEREFIERFKRLDRVEQAIVLHGMKTEDVTGTEKALDQYHRRKSAQ